MFIPAALASLTPRKERSGIAGPEAQAWSSMKTRPALLDHTAASPARPEYVLTHDTEILLDGKPCRYEDVPANARIIRMEVGADKKTVLKVLFRTRN
jgi:hypothetical protein